MAVRPWEHCRTLYVPRALPNTVKKDFGLIRVIANAAFITGGNNTLVNFG